MAKPLNINNVYMHYEKLCMSQPHHLATRTPKQLIYNYITTIPWKYEELTKKKLCKKSRSCIVVASWLQKKHL
jgi:hypothetical protein